MTVFLRQEIKNHRRTMSRAARRASYRRRFRGKYPYKAEAQLYKLIRDYFRLQTKGILSFIKARYATQKIRTDDFATEFSLFLRDLENEYEQAIGAGAFSLNYSSYMRRIAEFVRQFDEEELARYLATLTGGKPFYGTTEWWDEVSSAWIREMATRVSASVTYYHDVLNKTVIAAYQKDTPIEELIQQILELDSSFTVKRARFLAVDMTGKLNGEVTKRLHQSVGVNGYLWQTAMDERVRGRPGGRYGDALPSHWAMESLVCRWSDPSVVSYDYGTSWVPRNAIMPIYHPGMDWRCRCLGTPFTYDLLTKIDKELEFEGE